MMQNLRVLSIVTVESLILVILLVTNEYKSDSLNIMWDYTYDWSTRSLEWFKMEY